MLFDELGLPRDTGASDFEDSARLAGIMRLFGHPLAPPLSLYFDKDLEPIRHPQHKYDTSRDQVVCLLAGCSVRDRFLATLFWRKHKWNINKDIFSPSVRNHFRLCAGLPGTWFGYQWLKLDIWYNGKFSKIQTEQNQLICMCIIAGPEYVKRYVKANPYWEAQLVEYWCGWRGEPELQALMAQKIKGYL